MGLKGAKTHNFSTFIVMKFKYYVFGSGKVDSEVLMHVELNK